MTVREFRDERIDGETFATHGPLERFAGLAAIAELRSLDSLARVYRGRFDIWMPGVVNGVHTVHTDYAAAMGLYARGFTVYMPDVHRFVPALDALVRQTELDLGIRPGSVSATAFGSRRGAGATPHFDAGATFNIQLIGRKAWRLAPNESVDAPSIGHNLIFADYDLSHLAPECHAPLPSRFPANARKLRAEPGTLIFIPRGWWHDTRVLTPDSFAITLYIQPDTWARVLASLLERSLLRRQAWRQWPGVGPGGQGRAALEQQIRARLDEIAGLCRELSPGQLADELAPVSVRWRRTRTPAELTRVKGGWLLRASQGGRGHIHVEVPADLVDICRHILGRADDFSSQELLAIFPLRFEVGLSNLLGALVEAGVIAREAPAAKVEAQRNLAR